MPKHHGWATLGRQREPNPHILPWVSGRFYSAHDTISFATGASNTDLRAIPCYLPNVGGLTITKIGVEVTTLAAGGLARVGIYATRADGQPGKLKLDGGTLATDATGFIQNTISVFLEQGWWWLAGTVNTGTAAFRQNNAHAINRHGQAGCSEVTFWGSMRAFGVAALCTDVVANGLPQYFPLFSNQQMPATSDMRVMLGY